MAAVQPRRIHLRAVIRMSDRTSIPAAESPGAASSTRPAAASSASRWARSGRRPARSRTRALGPHFPPKAKSVIFLFMCGGVSHIDTFDPKDNKWAGKLIDAIGFGDNLAEMKRPVIPCLRTFTRYGKSGIPVSDWFPHVGGVIDDIAVVRSMWCHEGNHFPAVIETLHRPPRPAVRPSDASAAGFPTRSGTRQQESADLREHRPAVVAGAVDRRLPRRDRGGHAVPGRARRRSRTCTRRKGGSAAERERQMQALARAEPGVPRALRDQLRHRGPRQGVRTGRADAAVRARRSSISPTSRSTSGPLRHRREGDRRLRPATAAGPPAGGAGRPLRPDLPRRRRQRRLGRPRRHEDPCARSAGRPTSRSPA